VGIANRGGLPSFGEVAIIDQIYRTELKAMKPNINVTPPSINVSTPSVPGVNMPQIKPPRFNLSPNYKKSVVYVLAMVMLFVAIGALGLLTTAANIQWIYLAMQLLFVGAGLLHVWLMYRQNNWLDSERFWPGVWFSLLIMVLGAVAMVGGYFGLKALTNAHLTTAVLAFLIPYLVTRTLDYYLQIPRKQYKQWHYPMDRRAQDAIVDRLDTIDMSKMLVLQFEFPKTVQETKHTNFKAKAPLALLFGELFFVFLHDYNERHAEGTIDIFTPQKNPHGWVFYKKHHWWQRRRYMDPHLTFPANGILDNDIIVAERAG
jgi:hypothetical protein